MALRAVAVSAAVLAVTAPARGQTLADAARLAEAQRAANGGKSVVIKSGGPEEDEPLLTTAMVYNYGAARRQIALAMRYDGGLQKHVRETVDHLRSYETDIEVLIADEPQLRGIVESSGLSPRRYVQVETTLLRLQAHEANSRSVWPNETERFRQNLAFGRHNAEFVNRVLSTALHDELGLPGWTWKFTKW